MINIPADAATLWFNLLFAGGVVMQVCALRPRRRLLGLAGAALVLTAAVLDRDPTLAVGQIILVLLPFFARRNDL